MSLSDRLAALNDLRLRGLLTEAEFTLAKAPPPVPTSTVNAEEKVIMPPSTRPPSESVAAVMALSSPAPPNWSTQSTWPVRETRAATMSLSPAEGWSPTRPEV